MVAVPSATCPSVKPALLSIRIAREVRTILAWDRLPPIVSSLYSPSEVEQAIEQ